jgi:hypothetical protein
MKFIHLIFASLLVIAMMGCMRAKSNAHLRQDLDQYNQPIAIDSMADWLKIKRALIEVWREHLITLKDVDTLLKNRSGLTSRQPGAGGATRLNLASGEASTRVSTLEEAARLLQNQGLAIANYSAALNADANYNLQMAKMREMYHNMSIGGLDAYVREQRSRFEFARMGIDNDGARITNFGRVLENNSKDLDNQLKGLEVLLKGMYSAAYGSYVNSYAEYSNQIQRVWQSVGRVNAEVNAAFVQLRKYRREVGVCESRRKKISRLNNLAANEELRREVSLYNLPRIMRRFVASLEGEACLHKVLLTARFQNTSELNFINYNVKFDDSAIGRYCPLPTTADLNDLPVAAYPPEAIDPKTLESLGFYQPLTYYQVFRLIVDRSEDVEISPPRITRSAEVCRPSEFQPYLLKSLEAEKSMAETYTVAPPAAVTNPHGFSTSYGTIPASETKYRLFLERMTNLMRMTYQCVMDQRQLADAVGSLDSSQPAPTTTPEPPEKPASALLPLEAKKAAFSDFNIFMDESFPLMSRSVQECMNMAEHHRYRVFAQMEANGALLEILERAAKLPPPRSPHPVQFQPMNSPLSRPGNDF